MSSSTFRRNLVFVAGWVLAGVGIALLANHLLPSRTPSDPPPAAQISGGQLVQTSHTTVPVESVAPSSPSLLPPAPATTGASLDAMLAPNGSYAAAVKASAPAVVSVYTQTTKDGYQNQRTINGISRVPVKEVRQGLGSGVIVDAEGHIVTNEHVIEGADEIFVELADGRSASAKVVGADPGTDLAILKIGLPKLPVMQLGRADRVAVGDIVLAIGNPYGLSQTVTHGIVSAMDRRGVGVAVYENFIQTDAAINKGNSGGALVNVRGELIGINTAVLGETGAEGLGVAIPVDLVRGVMSEILRTAGPDGQPGRVVRGWVGVVTAEVSPQYAQEIGVPLSGLLIAQLHPASPARIAGLAVADRIETLDGQQVLTGKDLLSRIVKITPGTSVQMTGTRARNSQPYSVTLKVIEAPPGSQ